MLASYLARQYAMYAIANQYQQQGAGIVIPSVCFQSTSARLDLPDVRTLATSAVVSQAAAGQSSSVAPHSSPLDVSVPKRQKNRQKVQKRKEMSSEIKFSIERILAKSDSEDSAKDINEVDDTQLAADTLDMVNYAVDAEMNFSWLNCTRYKPPKLQRMRKKDGGKKRKLGRNPRVPFSQQQVAALEQKFCRTHYLSSMDVAELSTALNLTETRVKIWFQNRRARERRDRDTKRRLGTDLDQASSLSNNVVTYTPTSSVSTNTWRLNRVDTTAAFQTLKDVAQSGTSAFSPVPFGCKT